MTKPATATNALRTASATAKSKRVIGTTSFRIRPSIVLFGDSITEYGFGVNGHVGWASLLAAAYSRRADVLNRGFSGYNTAHYLDVLPQILGRCCRRQKRPLDSEQDPTSTLFSPTTATDVEIHFCTVFLGANDAALPGDPQNIPLDQYRQNLQRILQQIRDTTTSTPSLPSVVPLDEDDTNEHDPELTHRNSVFPIIVLTPPPVDEEAWARTMSLLKSNRTNIRAREYGKCAEQVASTMENCVCLDTWELLHGDQEVNRYEPYLSDGLHLSEEGNRKLFDGLMKLIYREYPHMVPMTDGEGKYGIMGIPLEEELWKVRCGVPLLKEK